MNLQVFGIGMTGLKLLWLLDINPQWQTLAGAAGFGSFVLLLRSQSLNFNTNVGFIRAQPEALGYIRIAPRDLSIYIMPSLDPPDDPDTTSLV